MRPLILFLLLLFQEFPSLTAQTCGDGGNGPCIIGSCPVAGDVCLNDEICCSPDQIMTTTTTAPTTTTTVTTTEAPTTTPCLDRCGPSGVSDCTRLSYLCNDSVYFDLMTQQCPATCGRCGVTLPPTCVDKTGTNGISDCPKYPNLCTDSVYFDLMTEQCPKTCGRCTNP